MICKNCGTENEEGAKICKVCGSDLKNSNSFLDYDEDTGTYTTTTSTRSGNSGPVRFVVLLVFLLVFFGAGYYINVLLMGSGSSSSASEEVELVLYENEDYIEAIGTGYGFSYIKYCVPETFTFQDYGYKAVTSKHYTKNDITICMYTASYGDAGEYLDHKMETYSDIFELNEGYDNVSYQDKEEIMANGISYTKAEVSYTKKSETEQIDTYEYLYYVTKVAGATSYVVEIEIKNNDESLTEEEIVDFLNITVL